MVVDMAAFTFGTSKFWRERAAEARATAEDMDDDDRSAMLEIAGIYEKIAERADVAAQVPPRSFRSVR